MKTIQEKIAVMLHFIAGGKVESKDIYGNWCEVRNPSWGWREFDYRIAEKVDPYAELKAAAKDPTKQTRLLNAYGKGEHSDWGNYDWSWSFPPEEYEIRDKPKPMKKVKLLAWFTRYELFWRAEGATNPPEWKRVPSADMEIEIEVEECSQS